MWGLRSGVYAMLFALYSIAVQSLLEGPRYAICALLCCCALRSGIYAVTSAPCHLRSVI